MFGNDDQNDNNQSSMPTEPVADGHLGSSDGATQLITPKLEPTTESVGSSDISTSVPPITDDPTSPAADTPNDQPMPSIVEPTPPSQANEPVVMPTPSDSSDEPVSENLKVEEELKPSLATTGEEDLLAIKQQALQELSPMVDSLKQPPEEKFKTIMMMIQASDNQSLIKDAHEAAKAIEDDEKRANALLDVVNEINYFTQHHNS